MSSIGIIGSGAWGTALAMAAHRAGNEVLIYARETHVVDSINQTFENITFLPNVSLDPNIKATSIFGDLSKSSIILLVPPAQFMRSTCENLSEFCPNGMPLVICSKGIELESGALMSEVVSETLPGMPMAVLSGPTFAQEVAKNLPSALTLSCDDETLAKVLMETLSSRFFRIYRSRDIIGPQIGGAVKNVLAIACGIIEGRQLGSNSKAAIMTRGLAEITRLGVSKGAKAETLFGLSGLGDLTLTCNDIQSRNFSLGVELGKGRELSKIIDERDSVAEGVYTASSVISLARKLNVDLPICSAVNDVLNHSLSIDKAINTLLNRPLKAEIL